LLMKNGFALFFCAAALTYAQDYPLGPDSQPQAGVPKGAVTKHTLAPGRFYPGTPHNYSVYLPAQYRADKPAPFMIFLDGSGRLGNGERVPVVFDNLIAKGELPPMIGIFVDPGVLPAISGAQNRFERVTLLSSRGLTIRLCGFRLLPKSADCKSARRMQSCPTGFRRRFAG
jgi:gluconolactonase